jgi:hypothetical protein
VVFLYSTEANFRAVIYIRDSNDKLWNLYFMVCSQIIDANGIDNFNTLGWKRRTREAGR